jgi:hypothetical protein
MHRPQQAQSHKARMRLQKVIVARAKEWGKQEDSRPWKPLEGRGTQGWIRCLKLFLPNWFRDWLHRLD